MKHIIGTKSIVTVLTCLLFFTSPSAHAGETEANALLVEAVQSIQMAGQVSAPEEKLSALNKAVRNLERIVSDHPSSGLAVSLITGQAIGNVDLKKLQAERDQLQVEVDTLRATNLAEAEAKEKKALWVDEIMECVEDYACAETQFLQLVEHKSGSYDNIALIAYLEAQRDGYSKKYDGLFRQMLESGADLKTSAGNAGFAYTIAAGILVEPVSRVYKEMKEFEKTHIPSDGMESWKWSVRIPPRVALFLGLVEKCDEYIKLLVEDGVYPSFEQGREDVYKSAFSWGYSELQSARSEKKLRSWSDSKHLLIIPTRYLATIGDSLFVFAHEQLVLDASMRTEVEAFPLMVQFLLATEKPDAAVSVMQSLPPEVVEGMGGWKLLDRYLGASLPYRSRATAKATKIYVRSILEQVEPQELDAKTTKTLLFASYVLN